MHIEDIWKDTIDDLLEVREPPSRTITEQLTIEVRDQLRESKSRAESHPRPDEYQAGESKEG
jgi:hypothetical protein